MTLTEILENIKNDLALVEERISNQLNTEIPLLNEVGKYILDSGGKRLRPAILIYAARLNGTPPDGVFTAAGALEFLHTATLLHDDVVDEADTRRAKKAARKVWGNPASVLVGDYLLATAFRSLTLLGHLGVLDTISQTTSQMAKGEILQLIRKYDSATEADYLAIIIHKTACLFAAAAKIGGALSGAGESVQETLYQYGNDLGIAFQIVDDALDYVEEREKVGKPLGIDLKEKKITLPLSRLLEIASPEEKKNLLNMLAKETIEDEDVHEVMALMKTHQVLPYTLKEAEKYASRAQTHLMALPASQERDILGQIARLIVERDF